MVTIRIFIVIAGTMFLCLSPNKAQQVKRIPISVITPSQSDSESVTCPPDDVKADALSLLQTEVSALLGNFMNQPRDCCQIANTTNAADTQSTSDIYNIADVCSAESDHTIVTSFTSSQSLQARCDMETDEGGWLVILRRTVDSNPRIDFRRTWTEYENGFGDLNTEFWYGLRNMHCLTQRDDLELRIDLQQNDGSGISWTYQQFKVAGPDDNYRLTIGGGVGTGGSDRMAYHNGWPFSTYDRDNDGSGGDCANSWQGVGWWHYICWHTLLTALPTPRWYNIEYTHAEMKVRPKSCLM